MEYILLRAYSRDKYDIRIFKPNESDIQRDVRYMDTVKRLSRLEVTKKEAV